jgi:hypothetical protein
MQLQQHRTVSYLSVTSGSQRVSTTAILRTDYNRRYIYASSNVIRMIKSRYMSGIWSSPLDKQKRPQKFAGKPKWNILLEIS